MGNQEKRLKVGGLEIAAKVWGNPGGRPVVALHGWLDNAASFDALGPLIEERLHLVAIDLPGHGRSEWRAEDGAYHFIDWVGSVLEVCDALGWEEFSILGHSMGAAIAALVGAVAPERVERMVFLDGIGPWSMAPEHVVEQLKKGLRQEKLLRHKEAGRYESMDELVAALGRARRDLSSESLQLLARRSAKEDEEGSWFLDFDRRLRASSRIRLTEEQVMAFLGGIECPVLLVRPDSGWPVEEEIIERRTSAISNLEIMAVEGGHHVHMAAPDRMAKRVRDFLIG